MKHLKQSFYQKLSFRWSRGSDYWYHAELRVYFLNHLSAEFVIMSVANDEENTPESPSVEFKWDNVTSPGLFPVQWSQVLNWNQNISKTTQWPSRSNFIRSSQFSFFVAEVFTIKKKLSQIENECSRYHLTNKMLCWIILTEISTFYIGLRISLQREKIQNRFAQK